MRHALAIGVVVGAMLAYGIDTCAGNRQLADLKAKGAAIQAAADRRDSATAASSDSMHAVIDSLQASKRPVVVLIARDSAAQDSLERAMAGLRTAADTIANQAGQIVLLKGEVAGLKQNARTDSLSLFKAMARSAMLEDSLHAQTRAVDSLNLAIKNVRRTTTGCGIGATAGLGLKGADAVAGFTCTVSLPRLPWEGKK